MAEQSTFVKVDRNMKRWRWFKDRITFQVFMLLIMDANIEDHDFYNRTIHRGQVVTSVASIGNSCNLTTQQVRTALKHLKSTGEITIESTNRYQVITIVNYGLYQNKTTNRLTNNQQTDNKQITNKQQRLKNIKNDKNEKNNKGRSAPDSPSGVPERGTKAFKAKSHLLLKREEGTVDDIPDMYRDMFDDFARYHDWRNQ